MNNYITRQIIKIEKIYQDFNSEEASLSDLIISIEVIAGNISDKKISNNIYDIAADMELTNAYLIENNLVLDCDRKKYLSNLFNKIVNILKSID